MEKQIKQLEKFIKDTYNEITQKNKNDYVYFYEIGENLFFVIGENSDGEILGKIAYNCDDLQCDYEFDWYFVEYNDKTANLYDYEITIDQTTDTTDTAKDIIKNYNNIITLLKRGIIKQW